MLPISTQNRILREWQFSRDDAGEAWTSVTLPHSPFVSDLDGHDHWQGVCTYKRIIRAENPQLDEHFSLYFHGAMHTARVSIDGRQICLHEGGYLPFSVDATSALGDGGEHEVVVEVDNRNNPDIPPGKPLEELDFCWYGGLYRDVELRRTSGVYITDAVAAGEVAGGGVFVRTFSASQRVAEVQVRVNLRNALQSDKSLMVDATVYCGTEIVARQSLPAIKLKQRASTHVDLMFTIGNPAQWSPSEPNLHTVGIILTDEGGKVCDSRAERFGIRRIEMSRGKGLIINGKRIRPRGTNRHQDHPWAGYALPAVAQRRDAVRIKEAGFDYVRLSHYPQSPDFLDACDELGILVMNCIPGWQFIGGEAFQNACYANARDLVRRDRNHPCIILWELSLNETQMPDDFMATMQKIGHEEYPGDQMFTCGWMDEFDVFIHSRQHGQIHTWQNGDKPLVVAEYGDWEFYAANEGFDQKSGRGLLDSSKNSRALRRDGEAKMLQQADNFAVALNDTLSCPAVTDGQWCMFDYPRGYEPARASCGVMDVFRLPKFSYYFYRSQREPSEGGKNWRGGPVVFIASNWTENSSPDVRVFANVEEVELRLNGTLIERKRAQSSDRFADLPHPPIEFALGCFQKGELEATGFINGQPVATHKVATPSAPASLNLRADTLGIDSMNEPDLFFVHVEIVDANGTLCVESSESIQLKLPDGFDSVGPNCVNADAGIASFLVRKSGNVKTGDIASSTDFTVLSGQVAAFAVGSSAICRQASLDFRT